MTMSSPSDNGTISSSGRSSPDDASSGSSSYRRASTPAQSFLPPRFWAHGSTGGGAMNTNNSGNTSSSNAYDQSGGFTSLPRRTSFGTAFSNSGRLSALSALGLGPSGNPALYGLPNNNNKDSNNNQESSRSRQQSNPGPQKGSYNNIGGGGRDASPPGLPPLAQQRSRTLFNANTLITTPEGTPTPSMPSSPVQKPRKRSVCLLPGPDGLCVEARSRRGSQA